MTSAGGIKFVAAGDRLHPEMQVEILELAPAGKIKHRAGRGIQHEHSGVNEADAESLWDSAGQDVRNRREQEVNQAQQQHEHYGLEQAIFVQFDAAAHRPKGTDAFDDESGSAEKYSPAMMMPGT